MNRSEKNREKQINDLRITNEYFEFHLEEIYRRESLTLKEFPELEVLDDDSNNDIGSDDDEDGVRGSDDEDVNNCSLQCSNISRRTSCTSKNHHLLFRPTTHIFWDIITQ